MWGVAQGVLWGETRRPMNLLLVLFILALYATGVWCLVFPRAFHSHALKPRGWSRPVIETSGALASVRAVGVIALLTAAFLTYASLWGSRSVAAQTPTYTLVDGSIGVVVLGDGYTRTDTIKLYNADGSLWYRFTYYYDDSDGKFDYPNDDFRPLGFGPDDFLLALEVVTERPDGYEVVVNRATGLRKRITKARVFRFLTWEQYALDAFAVDLSPRTTPLRREPRASSDSVRYRPHTRYIPLRIEGTWLQVRPEGSSGSDDAWIRWHDGAHLLVHFLNKD